VSAPLAIGIDVGGTHLRAASVGVEGPVGPVIRRASEVAVASELVASVVAVLEELDAGPGSPVAVGLGMAGLVDRDGRVRYGPNVGIREAPLAQLLREALGDPDRTVRVVNDASAAVVGEHRVGAARGHRDVVMFTLGTGVGGGAIVDGHLLEGAHGFAGEFGHLIISEGGRDAPSGIPGTVEAYVSGTAMAREAAEAVDAGLAGARAVNSRGVVAAAVAGESWASTVLERVGARLGLAVASVVSVLDPSIVVIGGGAGDAAAEFLLPAARASFAEHLMGSVHRPLPPLVPAALGDDAGLIGAGLIAADAAADAGAIRAEGPAGSPAGKRDR
jgi:glucokinase